MQFTWRGLGLLRTQYAVRIVIVRRHFRRSAVEAVTPIVEPIDESASLKVMRSTWSRSPAVAFAVSVLLLCGCDSGARDQISEPSGSADALPVSTVANGTVLLRLEKLEGFLIEGFQLQVRLEAPPGHPLISSTWDDLIHDQTPQPTGTESYYTSVIRTSVPAGAFVFTTVMHPGMESEQPGCVTRGQVAPGAVATVTLKFWVKDGCSTISLEGQG
jgi:hypothetical protein